MATLKVYTKEEITLEGNTRSIETVRDIAGIIDVDHRIVNLPNAGEIELISFGSNVPGPGSFTRSSNPLYIRITALSAGDDGMTLKVKTIDSGSYTQTLATEDTFMLNGGSTAIGFVTGSIQTTGSLENIESISVTPSVQSKVEYFIANAGGSLIN